MRTSLLRQLIIFTLIALVYWFAMGVLRTSIIYSGHGDIMGILIGILIVSTFPLFAAMIAGWNYVKRHQKSLKGWHLFWLIVLSVLILSFLTLGDAALRYSAKAEYLEMIRDHVQGDPLQSLVNEALVFAGINVALILIGYGPLTWLRARKLSKI